MYGFVINKQKHNIYSQVCSLDFQVIFIDDKKMKVSVTACDKYSDVLGAMRKCLKPLGGIKVIVKEGDKVLLKINQLIAKPSEHAVTTNPEFVRACIHLVKEAGGKPYVGDSPAIQSLKTVAKKSGIADICSKEKTPLVELKTVKTVKIKGRIVRSIKLARELDRFDKIINLPKLKTHQLAGLTGAVKNLFGCVPGRLKSMYHLRFIHVRQFSQLWLDIHDTINPDLNIMDGIIGMEGEGPGAGDPRLVGAVIASTNAIALDRVAINIVGIRPKEVPTIWHSQKEKKAESFIKNINVVGDTIRIKNFKRPRLLLRIISLYVPNIIKHIFTRKPFVNEKKCVSCKACYKVCPTGAITFPAKIPIFNYKKCIRCFCCHEVCPNKAIVLKGGIFAKLAIKLLGSTE